jgi:hypothetical protein
LRSNDLGKQETGEGKERRKQEREKNAGEGKRVQERGKECRTEEKNAGDRREEEG